MRPDDDQLRPQQIDDEIERLMQHTQEGTHENNGNAQLIQRLQQYYESEKQKKTLQRVWNSLAQRYEDGALSSKGEEHIHDKQSKLERSGQYTMYEQTMKIVPTKRNLPRWGTLVAVAVLALVIVSTVVVMGRAAIQRNGAPGTGGGGGNQPICLPTPTPAARQSGATPAPTAAPTVVPCCSPQPRVASGQSGVAPIPTAAPTVVPCSPTPTPSSRPPIATPTSVSGGQPPIATPTSVSGGKPTPTAVPPEPTAPPRAQPTPTAAP